MAGGWLLKRVVALVVPKGAGKTTIGTLLEERLGLRFVRTEPIFLSVRKALGAQNPDYERHGFQAVLARMYEELTAVDTLCFESTGASASFPWLVAELGKRADVLPVRVLAEPAQCLERIHGRDASLHIPLGDDQVTRINELALRVTAPWALELDNSGAFDADVVVRQMGALLGGRGPRGPG